MKRLVLGMVFLSFSFFAKADVVLPNIFSHNMVLQRNEPVNIFGFADAGEEITVVFQNQRKQTKADDKGNWKVVLDAMQANADGQTLKISGKNSVQLNNVLVGEVWLCSGQSNMEYQMRKIEKEKAPLKGSYFPKNEVAEADNPNIRVFLVRRKFLAKPDGKYQGWSVAKDSALRQFSAPAYFFAKKLQEELGVPVGVISSAVSGSRIEPWFAADYWDKSPYLSDKKKEGEPGKFYHLMIEPLAPYTLKGFIWYQGETNVFLKENISYSYKMKALIENWRDIWNNPEMPFYFTQIAPFAYSIDDKGEVRMPRTILPEFREAQDLVLRLPNTARIITTDLVDNVNDIHPNYKWEIGRRHALNALKYAYKRNILADSPEKKYVSYKGNKAVVNFNYTGKGLRSSDGKPITGFELAGKDGTYYPADVKLKKHKLVLQHDNVKNITAVRFAWDETIQPNLVNSEGLPAAPFRTNNPFKNIEFK